MADILVALFAIVANLLQFFLIVKGKVKVPRVSWIIWFVIIVICFVINLLFDGWDTATISLASFTAGNMLIAGYVLAKNPNGWTKREKRLLRLAFIILILWIPFKIMESEKTLLWATITSLVLLRTIHLIGVWEYWTKVWKDPFYESVWPWILRFTSALIASVHMITNQSAFLTKGRMWTSFSQPTYLWLTVSVTIILILTRRRKIRCT